MRIALMHSNMSLSLCILSAPLTGHSLTHCSIAPTRSLTMASAYGRRALESPNDHWPMEGFCVSLVLPSVRLLCGLWQWSLPWLWQL